MKKEMSYMDSVHRDGRIWNIGVMILLLAFPVSVAILFGAAPDWGALLKGLIAQGHLQTDKGIFHKNTSLKKSGFANQGSPGGELSRSD